MSRSPPHARRGLVRLRRTVVMIAVALLAIGIVRFAVSRGNDEESPESAVYSLAHGVEHQEAEEVCERRFPLDYLPPEVADRLGVTGGGLYSTTQWEEYRVQCVNELKTNKSYDAVGFEDALVRDVSTVPVTAAEGISAAAKARVSIGGARAKTVPLVRFLGTWRVVTDVPAI
jgi:hypothetical protein